MKTLLVIVIFLTAGCLNSGDDSGDHGTWAHHPDVDLPLPQMNVAAGTFADCDELSSWLQTKAGQYDYYTSWTGGDIAPVPYMVPAIGVGNPIALYRNPVNMVSPGVLSPDIVAADNSRLFVARAQSVEILDATDLHELQSLTFTDLNFPQIFALNNQLIVLGSDPNRESVTFKLYEPGANGDYLLQSDQTLNGNFVGARLNGGMVTVITEVLVQWDTYAPPAGGQFAGVACNLIRKPLIDDFDQGLTLISSLPVNGSGPVATVAAFGNSDVVYMTSGNHLYLGKYENVWFPWDQRLTGDWYQQLYITRYDLGSSTTFVAGGNAVGLPTDVHSFLEAADQSTLTLATSYYSADFRHSYHFTVLTLNGATLAPTSTSAEADDLSSRYSLQWLGNQAVVVGDALKIWDFTQPKQPTQVNSIDLALSAGALAQVSNALIFSLTNQTNSGLTLSLVNVNSPATPTIVDTMTLGNSQSNSEWLNDNRALDVEANYFALPMFVSPTSTGANIYATAAPFSLLGSVSHAEWVPSYCQTSLVNGASPSLDVRRVLTVNGQLISVSPFGAKASDPGSSFAITHATQFPDAANECTQQLNRPYSGAIFTNDPFYY